MAVSIEALAMAGTDYKEWGLDIKEWEDDDDLQFPPPHLLADENNEEPAARVAKQGIDDIFGSDSTTYHWKYLDAGGGERRHRRLYRNRTLPKKIKQSSRSVKWMMKYMSIMLVMIAMIIGKKRFLKPY